MKFNIKLVLVIIFAVVLVGSLGVLLIGKLKDDSWQERCRACRKSNPYCFSCCDEQDNRGSYKICP